MAIHLVPLVAGVAIGSLVTYLYKDENVRKGVTRTAKDVSGKARETARTASDKMADGIGALGERMARMRRTTDESQTSTSDAESSAESSSGPERLESASTEDTPGVARPD
ncbi:MAG: YtxH domain-containing protein [Halothiobacillaceae bacterium]